MPAAVKGAPSQRALTVREVAEYLSVDEKTIYRLVQRRELPGFKVAGAWRFRRAEIDAWIEASRETSAARVKGAPRLRALLVEDDEVDRMAIRRAMRDTDPLGAMEVVEVTSLADARAALAESRWDCVVVDRQLPDGDGLALLDEEDTLRGAAVVVLTGLEDEELARTALRQGAQDYLIKGRVEGAALLRSVRYAVERKRFEDERLRAEASFRALIEQSPDLVCALRRGHVAYVNPAFAALLSTGREQLEGLDFQTLVHDDDRAVLAAALGAPAGEAVRPLFQVRLRAQDGPWVQVEAWARPLLFDDAEAVLFTGRDVTSRKLLEDQVMVSSRMAATGTLAAGVAHEINNPLGFIVGNVDFALKELGEVSSALGGPAPPTANGLRDLQRRAASILESLGDAMEGARRVKYIVRDLKTLARPADNDEVPTPLERAVEWSIGVVANEVNHRARLVREFRASPLVLGGETKLGQIAMNLLLNAAQAITAGSADENEIRVVIDELPDRRALLEVHDTGCGITAEDLPRIFDPFFTTKPVGVGTGLGLAVCHGIVTSLGGAIAVESRPGATVFRVTVPTAAATPTAGGRPVELTDRRRRGRILVIEDEKLVASSLRRGLGRAHDVMISLSGKEALELLEGTSFDVILCDVMMPVMTGMDVYLQATARAPALAERFIFMTGGVFTPQARHFLESIANTRLEKPMDLDTLAALLDARVAAIDARQT